MDTNLHVLVRLADSCRIESYIIAETETDWEATYDEFIKNGWRHSFTRKIELSIEN
ncbi:hypothetical protein [Bacillus sp. H1a]|uniref:hypothetical protein n=1 Tax=Bacillus sp. H1a TaxID=1397276 RepID=UPI000A8E468F|nr:hypothetical protein [Bacillus sp. H1a]